MVCLTSRRMLLRSRGVSFVNPEKMPAGVVALAAPEAETVAAGSPVGTDAVWEVLFSVAMIFACKVRENSVE